MTLEQLQEQVCRAEKNLAAETNKRFPVGTKVAVKVSRGFMLGTVAFEASGDRVKVRSGRGQIHREHWSVVSYG